MSYTRATRRRGHCLAASGEPGTLAAHMQVKMDGWTVGVARGGRTVSKADFLERVRLGRGQLNETISGLSEEQMSQDLVTDEWTVKDILAHLAAWQHETVLAIRRVAAGEQGGPIITEAVDDWNAARVAERRRLPLVDVMQEFHSAYDELLAALDGWTDETCPLGPGDWDETARLWWLTEHDLEHVEAIQAYRKRAS